MYVCIYVCISSFRVDQKNSTTMMTNKNRLTPDTDQKWRNDIQMLRCHPTECLTSPKLQLRGSKMSVSNGAILPYFTHPTEKIFVYVSYHWRATFATITQYLQRSASIRIYGNFLVNSKVTIFVVNIFVNQRWKNEVV